MRLKRSFLGFLINFLLGVVWALAILTVAFTLKSYMVLGLDIAILISLFASLPSLFLVVILEYILSGEERLSEERKQTKLLEDILAQSKNG
jgi:hypothetical protein